jgi:formylglycine-generating enzyme required for sulfatase activity
VILTHDFEILAHEVTQASFQALMGYNPSYFSLACGSCPVEQVNWHEAAAYCNALSTKNSLPKCYFCTGTGTTVQCTDVSAYSGGKIYSCPGYRLPTEAEWEYAYRAGTTTAYYSGNNDASACASATKLDANANAIAWYSANTKSTQPVGTKQPNAWKLHDMAGNVWEWCHDWFISDLGTSTATDPWGASSGTTHLIRGGTWPNHAERLRAAARDHSLHSDRSAHVGVRCVRTITP